jgi:hypothetical protein
MKFTEEQLQQLVDHLQGSCNDLDSSIIELFGEEFSSINLLADDHMFIDDQIFLCDTCNWWFEKVDESEIHPGTCMDCHNDDEEDED